MAAIEPLAPATPPGWRHRLGRLARRWASQGARLLGALGGGVLAAGSAKAVDLPGDKAELMYHYYDGGGVVAQGPAVLVRKTVADKVTLSGSYFVDAVSNASIDVVTTASPFHETRNEYGTGLSYAVRDTLMSLNLSRSKEPDYLADTVSADMSQEVFGGMTTVAMGFSRGNDKIGQHGTSTGYIDSARHWQWRLGVTQVLTPRWLASLNFEAMNDDGFLGNAYRSARVFGALVPERDPRTRSARALKWRAVGDVGEQGTRASVNGAYRYFWDNWGISAHTLEAGYTRYVPLQQLWLVDGFARLSHQHAARFYSDNASAETTYITRSRQLSTFNSYSLGARGTWTAKSVPGQYDLKVTGSLERVHFDYLNFTDMRTGRPYSFTGWLVQMHVGATF